MVGEGPIRLAVEIMNLTTKFAEQGHGHRASYSIGRIHPDAKLPLKFDVVEYILVIRCNNVVKFQVALAMNKVAIIHDLAQPLNLWTENSIRSIADFEPIVFRWVVRGGNNNTTLSLQVTDGEIEDRAGTDTQISH